MGYYSGSCGFWRPKAGCSHCVASALPTEPPLQYIEKQGPFFPLASTAPLRWPLPPQVFFVWQYTWLHLVLISLAVSQTSFQGEALEHSFGWHSSFVCSRWASRGTRSSFSGRASLVEMVLLCFFLAGAQSVAKVTKSLVGISIIA